MATDNLARLQELLEELFQFGSADLDFGIYRIMKRKRAEVHRFLNTGLAKIVDDALSGGVAAQQASLASDLEEVAEQIRQNLAADAISADGELKPALRETNLGRRYEELRARAEGAVDLESLKGIVFNHVHAFFGRYYEGGDFVSKRRYSRRQRYAVPYNGEEVYLHWANADQYYVKTAEHFTNYRYTTADGAAVRFELVAADTEQNNVKGDRRFFVPRLSDLRVEEEARELTVPFEYRPLNEQETKVYGNQGQQEKIVEQVVEEIPKRLTKNATALAVIEPSDLLRKHLNRYTRRNTSDYFVHKDLKGFLEQELDFYLKNEVVVVDDIDASGPERADGWFEVMRAVKSVGRKIIAFLAQIENLQKKLFEKKKFVVNAGYCLTLDRISKDLYPEIVANEAQREEWVHLFAIDEVEGNLHDPAYSEPLTVEFLEANPYLMLDTKFFDGDFLDRLLSGIEELDEHIEGLLVDGENFQALNLTSRLYDGRVKCAYIDPPYNTGKDEFLYKDAYQHSSWLTMVEDRLRICQRFLEDAGVIFCSIDDQELPLLRTLMGRVFGDDNKVGTMVWKGATDNNPTRIAVEHEYLLCYAKDSDSLEPAWKNYNDDKKTLMLETYEEIKERSSSLKEIQSAFRQFIRDNKETLVPLTHYDRVDEDGPYTGGRKVHNPGKEGYRYDVIHPVTGKPCKQPARGYRFPEERMKELLAADKIIFGEDENQIIQIKEYLADYAGNLKSVVDLDSRVAANALEALFGSREMFRNPKPVQLISSLVSFAARRHDYVLDFFAGSGTTGHAVIDLNREDGGDRKYVLVEMGEYFDTVLKPRIQKVVYSRDWRSGKPTSRNSGVSHAFKYMKLESYEDSLNNVAFADGEAGENALELYGDDYLLRYMLAFETRDSDTLLSVGKLASPFDYKLTLHENGGTRATQVDLPETFAYLLGMSVATRKVYYDGERRYLVYRGPTAERDDVAVVWRDTAGWGVEELKRDRTFISESGMVEGAQELFVNGDSLIPDAKPLDSAFKRLMLPEKTL